MPPAISAGKSRCSCGVLKGCFFSWRTCSASDVQRSVDFMAVSSYGNGTSTTGAVKINKDLSQDIENRDVIIVEDILDSGITLSYLTKYLQNRKPSSICIATLLDKPARRRADVQAKYVGFTVRTPLSSATVWITRKSTAIAVHRRSQAGSIRKINL